MLAVGAVPSEYTYQLLMGNAQTVTGTIRTCSHLICKTWKHISVSECPLLTHEAA